MKSPVFKSDSEIETAYNKAIKTADVIEQENEKPGFWNWFKRAFSTDPETGERPEKTIRDAADSQLSFARKQ